MNPENSPPDESATPTHPDIALPEVPAPAEAPHSHPPRVSELRKRGLSIALILGLAVCGIGAGVGVMTGAFLNPLAKSNQQAAAAPAADQRTTVRVVKPKREASVAITVNQLATVEPYYHADLRARASGIVKNVFRDIGDKVKKGEVLIEIDVPESDQDVAKSEAMILQRQQELKVSEAKYKDAVAAKAVSAATIKQRDADVQGVTATRDLKKRKYERFKELAERGSVVGSVVDEEERDYLSSEAAVTSAKANVERARADYAESESKIEAAAADIDLKKAQIEVARKDLDRAKAVADYAKVRAPFDGVVTRCTVDPGSFVQNATTGNSETLIAVARVDIVSVTAKIPDAAAPSVAVDTPATVTVDDLPGVTIAAKVTRFAPSVQNADRTMRIEVDLFNGDEAEYQRLVDCVKKAGPDQPTKGAGTAVPVRAFASDAPKGRRLLPGMTGSIRLAVGGFGESHVLPNTAVYSRSGTPYIMLVENGKTRQVPVRVQLTDGKTVRVAIVAKRVEADGAARDVLTELTGQEEVVVARQLEVGDGASVKSGPSDW